jgi:hypothetical protein
MVELRAALKVELKVVLELKPKLKAFPPWTSP